MCKFDVATAHQIRGYFGLPRTWRASLIRSRWNLQFLGHVDAPTKQAAAAAAVEEFKLTDAQRKRLMLQPVHAG